VVPVLKRRPDTDEEVTDGKFQTAGCKLRSLRPNELRTRTAMATLNIEIAALNAGEVELKMPYSTAYAQQHGFISRRHYHHRTGYSLGICRLLADASSYRI
jgi:hypothetical protein